MGNNSRPSTTRRLMALGVGVVTAVTLTVSTAEANAAPSDPKDKQSTSVASGAAKLTAEAKAAGRAAYGKSATYEQSVEAYWTPERMRAAIPADRDPKLQKAARAFEAKQEQAAKTRKSRKPPKEDGPPRSVRSAQSAVFDHKGGAISDNKGPVTAAYNPNLPYYAPTARTMGKVFFTNGGLGYVCSGTVINSEGKDTVWTAGHCVHDGKNGTWHSNWSFVPAYDDDLANPRPYGTWTAKQLWTRSDWANKSDFSEDMGVAIMNTRNGHHIVSYFGGQGFAVNQGKRVYIRAFGYPAEWPFDGGNLRYCAGSTSPEWNAWFIWSQTLKMPCNMTRGSSGGGWMLNYDGNWGYLNGVNSRIDRIVNPTIMLSPYFDNDAWSLYNATRYL